MRQICACINAFGLLVFVVWRLRSRVVLRRHGVEVTGRCFRQYRPRKRGATQIFLRYTPPDGRGRVHIASERDCPPGTGVGTEVTLLCDPRKPERCETALVVGRPPWRYFDLYALFALAVGLAATSPYV
ncbi:MULTISPECIES: DUF3592 domain-containing protein [unclassified Streptomyces]|uniref:DUF3592 domain-containing protein n=1 Tax=unclassified Streptomyces TaxID=2593676 RepID=UPI001BE60304|nr:MULTISPECIES: DUF3592 domain-containing protein [unclassified Streptomyces]MBT2408416.1 hypothetical protein [Streptomyces sp. ISL-21]MBT2608153.1 hypothetical protein [Streptomyces sp. ISL-87]